MFFRITGLARLGGARGAVAVLAAASIGLSCGDDGPTESGGNGDADPDLTAYDVPADGTLGDVLAVASAGDTIRVAAGTHAVDENLRIEPAQAGLRIVGRELARGETRPVLMCTVAGTALRIDNGAEDVVIAGLEMRGTFSTGIEIAAGNVTVEDMWIEGATFYAIVCQAPANGPVRGNVLVDAGVFGVRCTTGAAPLITQNTIVGAGDCGIYIQSASPVVERNAITIRLTLARRTMEGNWIRKSVETVITCRNNPL